jgi:hypothetical protein
MSAIGKIIPLCDALKLIDDELDIVVAEQYYDKLYEYYVNNGEMPYGTAKARDGDPAIWILNQVTIELGM